jgi:hypothetical protein
MHAFVVIVGGGIGGSTLASSPMPPCGSRRISALRAVSSQARPT